MTYLKAIFWSLTFPLCVVIGQPIGHIIASLFYFVYIEIMFLTMPQFIIIIGPTIIAGLVGGLFAAFIINRFAQPVKLIVTLIVPVLVTAVALIGAFLGYSNRGDLLILVANSLANLVGLFIFYYLIKAERDRRNLSLIGSGSEQRSKHEVHDIPNE